MKVRIVERYSSDSDVLKKYVLKKVDGLSRYFDQIVSIDAILDVERGRHRVELVGHLVNRKIVKAEVETGDMYASVDQAVDKLQRQLVRYKEQLRVERKTGKPEPAPAASDPDSVRIVRLETYFRKPMSPEEAALQLEASGRDFLVFFNSEDDSPAVIFRRGNGEYGLILPRK
ncbi:MAG: Sigma-54 modulation protein [Acetothermia bacterium 64_32]|nr:MAG: Sigma-54 modulation protein [Acetothermia bacterium 64_32]HAF70223.1 ribosome-associated translation inhibitor RaiA [Candidatus Acetothermia bacterium]